MIGAPEHFKDGVLEEENLANGIAGRCWVLFILFVLRPQKLMGYEFFPGMPGMAW